MYKLTIEYYSPLGAAEKQVFTFGTYGEMAKFMEFTEQSIQNMGGILSGFVITKE